MKYNSRDYFRATGVLPAQDDLERVNCDKVGAFGHSQCGWCETHNRPRSYCPSECHVEETEFHDDPDPCPICRNPDPYEDPCGCFTELHYGKD
jgi:hypothetical protein